jgi:hypothetical protein
MADKVDKKKREEAEALLYKVLDTVDPSKTNSDYYRAILSKMTDEQFYKFFERRLPIRFHYEPFKIEPTMPQIYDAFKIINKSLIEKVNFPHIYKNKDGVPVQSQPCLVMYIHIKRMKQMVAKKSHVALNTEKRDMRTGLLSGADKGAKETDREFEALAAYGLEYTMDEFSRPRADSLRSAAEMNNIILDKGSVSEKDFTVETDDSLAKNMLNVYLLAANIHSNLVDTNYMTPYTARNKQQQIERL